MEFTVTFESNAKGLSLWLKDVARDQVPFATAKSLTLLAVMARDDLRRGLEKRFTIRSKRVPKGIRSEKALKKDWPKTFSVVGVLDEFIARHEEGGIQKPARNRTRKGAARAPGSDSSGGRRFAIPTRFVKSKRTQTGKVPKRLQPTHLIVAGKAYIRPGSETIQRTQGRRGRGVGGRLGVLFILRKRIKLQPRLKARDTVQATMAREYPKVFERELHSAVRSSMARFRKRGFPT